MYSLSPTDASARIQIDNARLMIMSAFLLGTVVTVLTDIVYGIQVASPGFLLLATIVVLTLAVFRPRLAVFSLAVSTPLTPEFPLSILGVDSGMLNLDLILIPVVLLRYLVAAGMADMKLSLSDLDISILLFAGVAALSLLFEITSFSMEILVSMLYLAEWVAYCSLPFIIRKYVRSRHDVRLFFGLLVVAAAAIMLHLLVRHLVLDVPRLPSGRGTFKNPLGPGTVNRLRTFWSQNSNAVGAFLALHATVVAGITPALERRVKPLAYVFLLVCGYLIFWTFSRSAMIAAGTGIGVITVAYRPFAALLFTVSGSITAVTVVPKRILIRIWLTFRPSQYVPLPIGGLDSRLSAWVRQIKLFVQEPILGTGFHLVPETLARTNYGGAWAPDNAHLQVLIGTGIVGYLVYLCVFAIAFRYSFSIATHRTDPLFRGIGMGVSGALIGFLLSSMFYDIFGRWRLLGPLFCYIGLAVAINDIDNKTASEPCDYTSPTSSDSR